ncbi:MAG: cytochrome c oxidase accessory protein CcoG [Limisphaerales bacterium]
MNLIADKDEVQQDFRNHLATADKQGHRRWIFAKKVSGKWFLRRTHVSWVLLAIMFIGPFITINGNPLLMLNIVERRFSILGQIFWPQDVAIFAVAMLLFLTGIVVFTTAFGRLWCGWTCPQTVLMEMVFRKIEYAIEGDSDAQQKLHAAPWNREKILKKGFKQIVFFILSFVIANWLLSYIIGMDALKTIITDDPRRHISGLVSIVVFTIIFYLIFARFREQACTFICPYGRFQSAMLDENSMIVAYDHKRGEVRGRLQRAQTRGNRKAEGLGDCVSCRQCVSVCPTGIDIRNGLQMECVNCTACIDACDKVMDKLGWERGLIRYASLDSIERGTPFKFTARMAGYAAVLTALITLFCVLLFTRSAVDCTLLRAPGGLFQEGADGKISNLYTVKVINKTRRDIPLTFRLEEGAGKVEVMGASEFIAPKENLTQTSILILLDRSALVNGKSKIKVGVYAGSKRIETLKTSFIGPRN